MLEFPKLVMLMEDEVVGCNNKIIVVIEKLDSLNLRIILNEYSRTVSLVMRGHIPLLALISRICKSGAKQKS
jgi:hypothetical protein